MADAAAASPASGALPTLAALADAVAAACDADAFPAPERGGVWPGRPAPPDRPVARLGLALEPTPVLAAWVARERLDALFLHRPWRLAPDALPPDVGVLWCHLPFDERLTTGWNRPLADALALADPVPFAHRDGRPLGMIGDVAPAPAAALAARVRAEFGGAESFVPAATPDAPVARVAVVGAMTDAFVREAAARGAGLYVTGQLRAPARAAVAACGLAVLAVGHARSERWGLAALAAALGARWPALAIRLAPADG